jgi:hypothetical protein
MFLCFLEKTDAAEDTQILCLPNPFPKEYKDYDSNNSQALNRPLRKYGLNR